MLINAMGQPKESEVKISQLTTLAGKQLAKRLTSYGHLSQTDSDFLDAHLSLCCR